jgi:general secretion pathway protein E
LHFGERIVMRLLDKNTTPRPDGHRMARRRCWGWMRSSSAPTASSWSPTHRLGEDHHALRGAEPINTRPEHPHRRGSGEHQLQGIGQMAINPKIGLTFAAGLRSFLRQDPDVIMVGEIRDRRRRRSPSRPRSPGTGLPPSTPTTRPAPSPVWWTWAWSPSSSPPRSPR